MRQPECDAVFGEHALQGDDELGARQTVLEAAVLRAGGARQAERRGDQASGEEKFGPPAGATPRSEFVT